MSEALMRAGEPSLAGSRVRAAIWLVPAIACGLIVVAKLLLITRINVNWDEFLYLTQVHAYVRGELGSVFQTPFTHLFVWLPAIGDEMAQIISARWVMMALFAGSVVLLVKLASRWASSGTVWIAPLCYLAASPVLVHAGSFRADSLLLPLTLGALVLLTRPARSTRATILVGICCGAALAVSVKAVFLLPTLVVIELSRTSWSASEWRHSARVAAGRLLLIGSVAAGLAGLIFVMHWWSLPAASDADARSFATAASHKALLDVPFFPRWAYFRISLAHDKVTWTLIALGAAFALKRRLWPVLGCALSLAPLLIYRNAFPYYYLIMLAPACALAPIAVEGVAEIAHRSSAAVRLKWIPIAACGLLTFQALVTLGWLAPDDQRNERAVIAAVHQVFPTPVPYIDHSGMIASFRKVNFFMSTWGVETYRANGRSFMSEALARFRPPLLLVNRGELDPEDYAFRWLLPEDQQLIRSFYVPYWGPIRVAGAEVEVPASGSVTAHLPFPGRYRLETPVPIVVGGIVRSGGDQVELAEDSCSLSRLEGTGGEPVAVRLVWADARPPPTQEPSPFPLYSGL